MLQRSLTLWSLVAVVGMGACKRAEPPTAEGATAPPVAPTTAVNTGDPGDPGAGGAKGAGHEPDPGAAPGAPVAAAAQHGTYEPSSIGMCKRGLDCHCADLQGKSVDECVQMVDGALSGKPLPDALWSCLNTMDCRDVCSADSPARKACVQRVYGAAAAAQAAHHKATMGIINNMGTQCPAGQHAVHGHCQP